MRTAAVLAVAVALLAVASALPAYTRTVRYDGEKVFRCQFGPQRAVNSAMYRLIIDQGLDIWGRTEDYIDVRVKKAQFAEPTVRNLMSRCDVLHADLEAVMAEADAKFLARREAKKAEWFEDYHTYDEIKAWYEDLANTYSDFATFIDSIGTTLEGRDQFAFTFTSSNGTALKPKIFFQCQIHAREWISGATCGYVINELLSTYGSNDEVTAILDAVEFVVIPIQNPDGYAYTWSNDRLWRKNRNPNTGGCAGVDLNRNYNDHWGQGGSSSSPCSDTYMGPSANSELEVQNAIAFFKANAPVIGGIDWHSYSQLILRPYGWTRNDSPDEAQLKALGDGMREAIREVHGVSYTSQKSIELYTTTGTASDWFYGEEATETNDGYRAAGFTIELRDTGRYGFELPAEQIIPTGEECFQAVLFFVSELVANPIKA